ncbi:helix-turn-helix transcriptional regulator [Microbacterium sp. cx-59]|uniref:helix-turn-helix domain-containing protein n=1 Tax=Microbacterium sp. cx-59 TaxID=2891207 RepID=UPI001E522EC3|nr:helix-turn-helix transcriptional regulator [Microbacterium sp. cx-59]MCC4906927.1 helix-turn-helix transcriptional regulator [Microbacterium sp. cx-59]
MELHASDEAANQLASQRLAGEMRAELARQKRTASDLAAALGITPHTVGRRLNGDVPFNMIELATACRWLGIDLTEFVGRASTGAKAMAS